VTLLSRSFFFSYHQLPSHCLFCLIWAFSFRPCFFIVHEVIPREFLCVVEPVSPRFSGLYWLALFRRCMPSRVFPVICTFFSPSLFIFLVLSMSTSDNTIAAMIDRCLLCFPSPSLGGNGFAVFRICSYPRTQSLASDTGQLPPVLDHNHSTPPP